MYGPDVRAAALARMGGPASLSSISRDLGVSRATLREWRLHGDPLGTAAASTCLRCQFPPVDPPGPEYSHLLGLYLGDGCISALRKGVFSLRVSCCDSYPRLMDECQASMLAVHPAKVFRVAKVGCTDVMSYWKHWPCLFPQHGPGRKHQRPIVLAQWQKDIVVRHPGPFVRGLIHSDGCRITNWTVRLVAGEPRRYEYPRYFFTNTSTDILRLCCWALDLLEISHRHPTTRNISIARKAAVARLDELVGPKS